MGTSEILPPFYRHYRMHLPAHLHMKDMQDAATKMQGLHNFIYFCGNRRKTLTSVRSSHVKLVHDINISRIDDGVQFRIRGDGFLYHQVRHMVGALLAIW